MGLSQPTWYHNMAPQEKGQLLYTYMNGSFGYISVSVLNTFIQLWYAWLIPDGVFSFDDDNTADAEDSPLGKPPGAVLYHHGCFWLLALAHKW